MEKPRLLLSRLVTGAGVLVFSGWLMAAGVTETASQASPQPMDNTDKSPENQPAAATSIATAPSKSASSASLAHARGVLQGLSQGLSSLKADFRQYQLGPDGRHEDINTGTVALQAPNKFRWHYRQPQEQLIIATGDEILIFDPDLEQLTIKPQNQDSSPIYVLFNPDLIDTHYRLAASEQRDGLLWVKILPLKPANNVQQVWLGINEKTGQLLRIHMLDNLNQTVVFEFDQIQRNPSLDSSLFHFDPPEGVDVVRDQPAGGEF